MAQTDKAFLCESECEPHVYLHADIGMISTHVP